MRKIDETPKSKQINNNNTNIVGSKPDAVFKVPEIPRMIRKVDSNRPPAKDSSTKTINETSFHEESFELTPSHIPIDTTDNGPTKPTADEILSPKKIIASIDRYHENSPEAASEHEKLSEMFKAVMEKNARQMNQSIQKVFNETFNESQDRMAKMQLIHSGKVVELQCSKANLQSELDYLNGEYGAQLLKLQSSEQENLKLNEMLVAANTKMAEMSAKLRDSKAK